MTDHEMLKAHQLGLPVRVIAEQAGMNPNTVYRRIRRLPGFRRRHDKQRIPADVEVSECVSM